MPPKKNDQSKKSADKAKKKIIEDKTFGLKNKKGKKQQQYISSVSQQVKGTSTKQLEKERLIQREKKAQEEDKKEIQSLFKPVVVKQVIEPGVNPKSVLCQYFKQGACNKGDKCKFSHDLSVEFRSEKKDIYTDVREESGDKDTNDLNQEELERMIEKKHGKSNNASEKICKYFLEAVEKRLYGWFWTCPNNGDNCQYRHALPPGYVLERDKAPLSRFEQRPIEEIIEEERYNLEGDLVPITEETFKLWKLEKIKQKRANLELEMNRKKDEMESGKVTSKITGKEAFCIDPTLIKQDDEEANDNVDYELQENAPTYEEVIREKLKNIRIEDERVTRAFALNPKQRACEQAMINQNK